MDRSMISMIYFVALLALFLIMIIATIAVIASKSKRRYDDDDEFEGMEDVPDEPETDDPDGQTVFADSDAMFGDDFYVDNLEFDNAGVQDIADEQDDAYDTIDAEQAEDVQTYDDDIFDEYEDVEVDTYDAEFDSAFAPEFDPIMPNAPTQEIDTKAVREERSNPAAAEEIPVIDDSMEGVQDESVDLESQDLESEAEDVEDVPDTQDMEAVQMEADSIQEVPDTTALSDAEPLSDDVNMPDQPEEEVPAEETEKPARKKHIRKAKKEAQKDISRVVEPAAADTFEDSAFAPEIPEIGLSNEALAASVREAEAMGAAIMGDLKAANVPAETMFGINEQLSSYGSKKQKRTKSNVSSDEDFYWYNKEDVAERPARRSAESYYHHFNVAADCVEDLLVEMYDCALVRTEEIRYIAYGIEPRTLSMKEIMSGTVSLSAGKKKEPTEQDMVRIYEKWCGYVDRLLDDTVEIHADEYTIEAIRKQLCAYGRSDVDTLLEGK